MSEPRLQISGVHLLGTAQLERGLLLHTYLIMWKTCMTTLRDMGTRKTDFTLNVIELNGMCRCSVCHADETSWSLSLSDRTSDLSNVSYGGQASRNAGAAAASRRVSYLLVRRQAVETCALTAARWLGTPQQSPSVAEAGAQRHGPGPRSVVKSPQTAGSGHGAGTESSRPGREGTGTGEPGGRPEPQDETEHFAAGWNTTRSCWIMDLSYTGIRDKTGTESVCAFRTGPSSLLTFQWPPHVKTHCFTALLFVLP